MHRSQYERVALAASRWPRICRRSFSGHPIRDRGAFNTATWECDSIWSRGAVACVRDFYSHTFLCGKLTLCAKNKCQHDCALGVGPTVSVQATRSAQKKQEQEQCIVRLLYESKRSIEKRYSIDCTSQNAQCISANNAPRLMCKI